MGADALLAKAISSHQQGKHEEAEVSYRAVLKKQPKNFIALHHLGVLACGQNELDKAHDFISQALALDGDFSEAHNNLGNVLRAQGKTEEAAASYARAVQINPSNTSALSNLALTLIDQSKISEAIAALEKALTIDPRFLLARFNLGIAYQLGGQPDKAASQYRGAIEINPALVPAYINLGDLLCNLGRLTEAIDVLQKAAQLQANSQVLTNLGICYHRAGRIKEAEECLHEAVRLKPDEEALANLGLNLAHQGRREEAVAFNRAAVKVNPNFAVAVSNVFFEQRHLCDWQDFEAAENRLRELVRNGQRVAPFAFATANTPPDEQLICARTWAASIYRPLRDAPISPEARRPGPIRIGYLSNDFCEHATAFLMAEMLERHDHERFEIFAYSFSADDGSAIRQRLIAAFDHFIDISAMPHEAAIRKIRDDGVDILIDLKGYTRDARAEIMAGALPPFR